MRVIGTAGHVDHGKTTLVRSLTGIDTDRLAEEKARALTIDLGFAWLTLPNGEQLGIIDVPGHRDFIENMLAGVGGIDAVLLVIAADEGVMPQTREHLAILDLLGINAGLVVLSRVDLVDDPEWLELVEDEARELLADTCLAEAPVLPVSATTGAGMDALLTQLAALPGGRPSRQDFGQPRLPVDRVFTMSGFGTVVTGTLNGGALRVGDEVELQPGDLRGRIRGLQCYRQKVSEAWPGSRVAVNVSGLRTAEVERGHVLGRPGQPRPTLLADVRFRYLPSAPRPLTHNAEVKFFSGTCEAVARVRLLEGDELSPGDSGWLQLRFARELPLSIAERFILRWPSPAETIGGGAILDPHPGRHWRRNQPQVLRRLRILSGGSPEERVTLAARGRKPRSRDELRQLSGMAPPDFDLALEKALQAETVAGLPDGRLLAAEDRDALTRELREVLEDRHRKFPLRRGMQREDLRSTLQIEAGLLGFLLDNDEAVSARAEVVSLRGHEVRFSPEQQARVRELEARLDAQAYAPPSWSEALSMTGEELLLALVEDGTLVRASPEVFFSRTSWENMLRATLEIMESDGSVSASQLRDRFNTSRKYAIALLESLDEARITRREGDVRVRGAASPSTLLGENRARTVEQRHP